MFSNRVLPDCQHALCKKIEPNRQQELGIHDCQITIAYLAIKERRIAITYCSNCQQSFSNKRMQNG
jgi:hypothetical protein